MRGAAGLRERIGTSESVAQSLVFSDIVLCRDGGRFYFLKLFSMSFVTECLDDRVFGHRRVSSGVFEAQLLDL